MRFVHFRRLFVVRGSLYLNIFTKTKIRSLLVPLCRWFFSVNSNLYMCLDNFLLRTHHYNTILVYCSGRNPTPLRIAPQNVRRLTGASSSDEMCSSAHSPTNGIDDPGRVLRMQARAPSSREMTETVRLLYYILARNGELLIRKIAVHNSLPNRRH